MRVLVTGASGFVGSEVVRQFSSAGGFEPVAALRRPASVSGAATVTVGDLGPETDWTHALDGVDAVVHCAGRAHQLDDSAADSLSEFRRVNVEGTRRLAECAQAAGVRRFIYMSSAKVHGEATHERPFRESDAPAPFDPYAISKHEAERALAEVAASTGLEIVTLRPPVVYGANPKANMLRLTQWVAKGVPLPLALVRNRRSMVSLANLSSAVVTCLMHPAAARQTYLVSDQHDLSTPQLIEMIASALRRPPRLWPVPAWALRMSGRLAGRVNDVERLVGSLEVDSALISRQLDWHPLQSPHEGICEMVSSLENRKLSYSE